MGFLTKFIPGGWILYALIGASLLVAGTYTGARWRGSVDAPIIAKAQIAQARAESDTAQVRTALAEQQRLTAEDALKATNESLAREKALQGQVSDLTAKMALTERARQAASTQLLDTLKAIPHEQQATLSASVRAYLVGVRDAQSSGSDPTPAADHHEDGPGISNRAHGIP